MKPTAWSLASLAVLGLAGWQAVDTLSRMPAFNRGLQVETATGGTIPIFTEAMYSRAAYSLAVAQEWHYRTFDAVLPGEAGSARRREALLLRSSRARDIARESLRHNPADPAAWMVVAKGEATLGFGERALQAWQNSHDLAPHSALRALERSYFLIGFMSDKEGWDMALSKIAPARVQADLNTIRIRSDIRPLAEQLHASPAILAFEVFEADRN